MPPSLLATALLLQTHDRVSQVAGSKGNQPDAGGFQAGDDGEARRSGCLSARKSLASLPTMSRAMSPVKNLGLSLPYLPRPRVSPRHDSNLLPQDRGTGGATVGSSPAGSRAREAYGRRQSAAGRPGGGGCGRGTIFPHARDCALRHGPAHPYSGAGTLNSD